MSKQQQWMRNRAGGPLHKADISCASNGCWPVAVIDVEDREQVERLVRSFWDNGTDAADDAAAMRAALREFADPKPPKPEEPQNPAATVIDSDGVVWVSWRQVGLTTHRRPWQALVFDQEEDDFRDYADIDVVRIVSDGVQAGESA